ncbi:hypothetical protein HM1_1420 [Heliomicrobium modesticaldum Ice1]|uniref:Uncharacterized protein n=1 Tax=Heliobacterium modesticaldum (strain ATCC 51547 / Ice1) TaxID=498761 RepID=B0TC98_HELMI|nr:hypothetical protein HM1_1420 [Heliomicrobium modesticaldum Ice1]
MYCPAFGSQSRLPDDWGELLPYGGASLLKEDLRLKKTDLALYGFYEGEGGSRSRSGNMSKNTFARHGIKPKKEG